MLEKDESLTLKERVLSALLDGTRREPADTLETHKPTKGVTELSLKAHVVLSNGC